MQDRDGGGQGTDAGRDAHRYVEEVVDHQGGRSEQSRIGSEVLLGDDLATATVGIRCDSLPIRDEQDCQQDEYHPHDRADVEEAGRAGSRQDGERRFRPRRERIRERPIPWQERR
jgi:hypothetical protein